MKKQSFALLALASLAATAPAPAAVLVNDGETIAEVTVTEGGRRQPVMVGAGREQEFCSDGCFVTFADGDIVALSGDERVIVSGTGGRVEAASEH